MKHLLDNFIGEYVTVFLCDMPIKQESEEGYLEAPMIVEGYMVDYDEDFILFSNETKTSFTLLNQMNIAKIDSYDGNELIEGESVGKKEDLN